MRLFYSRLQKIFIASIKFLKPQYVVKDRSIQTCSKMCKSSDPSRENIKHGIKKKKDGVGMPGSEM